MSVNITVYDPTTGHSKNIAISMGAAMIIQDLDTTYDFFLMLTTSAKKVSGAAIPTHTIKTLNSGVDGEGTTRHNGTTPSPLYSNLSDAVTDHIWDMIDGSGGSDAMSFA